MKKKVWICFVSTLLMLCMGLSFVPVFPIVAEAASAELANERNVAVAIPASSKSGNSEAINLVSKYLSSGKSLKGFTMPFFICSGNNSIAIINNEVSDTSNKEITNIITVGDVNNFTRNFGVTTQASVGNGTTYEVDGTSYGISNFDEFGYGGTDYFKPGVLNVEDLTVDELNASSFYFVPVGDESYTSEYYIYVNLPSTTSNSTYQYYLCVDSSLDDDYDYAVDYELKLVRRDPGVTDEYLKTLATKWTLTPKGNDGEFTCTTKAEVYEYNSKKKDTIIVYLAVGDSKNFTSSNAMFAKPLDYLNAKNESAPTIRLYGNLNLFSKTDIKYDAYRIIDGSTTKNIVVKTNTTSGEEPTIVLPRASESKTGYLDYWSVNMPPVKYCRGFEDYTDGGKYSSYLWDDSVVDPSVAYPTGYEPGKVFTERSQYAGKSFYAIIKYTLTYSATNLAEGNSFDVRVGTPKVNEVYASQTDVKSGDGVTGGNWVSIAVPLASKTGYKYTIDNVIIEDSSGKRLSLVDETERGSSGEIIVRKKADISNYAIRELSAGAQCVTFTMPNYAISVKIYLKRESIPVTQGANGYFITEDSNGKKEYTGYVKANSFTPVELVVSTKGISSDGNDLFIIKEYHDYENNEYYVDNDDYMYYTINSCKWYVKIGDNGEYKELGGDVTYDGTRAVTSSYVYLPSVSSDTKVYYKCEYTVKRAATGAVGETKQLVLTADVTENKTIPANSMYVSYQDSADIDDYYTSGKTFDVGHEVKLWASRFPKNDDYIVIIAEGPNVEDDTVSRFSYAITWYIQPTDKSIEPIALNSTPVTISPANVKALEANYTCTLPKLLDQKTTAANIWFEVTKTDKATGKSVKFSSSKATLNVNYSGYTPTIEDYDASIVASLEEDHLYIDAGKIRSWKYSTNNGATYTEIPLTSLSTDSDSALLDAVRTNPDPSVNVGKTWVSTRSVYGFTVTEPGVYTFLLTNDMGKESMVKLDFTSLHTHQWSDWIYDEGYHYKKCTVENCQAVTVGEDHVKNSSGVCIVCQNGEPDTILVSFEKNGGEWVDGYNPPESYLQNETLSLPTAENIKRTGYAFDGWILEEDSTSTQENYEAKWKCDHTLNENPRSCTEPTTCSVCGSTLDLVEHALNTGYSHDEITHWQTCENCTTKLNEEKHSGGEANCCKQANCAVCGESYGELNSEKHTGEEMWLQTDSTHIKKWSCCGKIIVEEEPHELEEGVCKDCGYKADCEHIQGSDWLYDEENHWHICTNEGCGVVIKTSVEKHNPSLAVPTETEAVVCTECGYEIAPALGHTFDQENKELEGALKSPADCTHDAVYYKSCTCGEISTTETFTDEGSALGHEEITDPRVEPTCTFTGLTEGKHCERCKKILVKQKILAKLSHDYGDDDICDDCGYDKNHKHSYQQKKDSVSHWQQCDCGDIAQKENHVYDDSCDSDCNICGYVRFASPKTADTSKVLLWSALMLISAITASIAVVGKRKKSKVK